MAQREGDWKDEAIAACEAQKLGHRDYPTGRDWDAAIGRCIEAVSALDGSSEADTVLGQQMRRMHNAAQAKGHIHDCSVVDDILSDTPIDALPAAPPEGSDDEFAKATTDDQALRGYVCPECPWHPIARPDVPVDAVQMQVSQHGAIHGLAVALREAADALPAVTTPLMVTDITQDQANELQDILRTLTNSGTALITSARDLVKRYEALLKQSASVVQTAPVEAKTTTYLLQNPRDPEWFDEQIEWFSHGPEKVDRAEVVKCLKAGKQFAALPAPAVPAPADAKKHYGHCQAWRGEAPCTCGGKPESAAPADAPRWTAEIVEGRTLPMSIDFFEQRCLHLIASERNCEWPEMTLVDALSNAVRLAREFTDYRAAAPSGGARQESAWQDMATAKPSGGMIIAQTLTGEVVPVVWNDGLACWVTCSGWQGTFVLWQPLPPPTPTPQPKGKD